MPCKTSRKKSVFHNQFRNFFFVKLQKKGSFLPLESPRNFERGSLFQSAAAVCSVRKLHISYTRSYFCSGLRDSGNGLRMGVFTTLRVLFEKGGKLRKFYNFAKKGGIFKRKSLRFCGKKGCFFYTQKREKGGVFNSFTRAWSPESYESDGTGISPPGVQLTFWKFTCTNHV